MQERGWAQERPHPFLGSSFLSTLAIGIYKLRFVYRGYQHRCQNQALPTSRLGNDSGPSCYKYKGCRYMHICFQPMGKQVVLTAQTHGPKDHFFDLCCNKLCD